MQTKIQRLLVLTEQMHEYASTGDWEHYQQIAQQRETFIASLTATAGPMLESDSKHAIAAMLEEVGQIEGKIRLLAQEGRKEAQGEIGKISRSNQAISAYKMMR